MKNKKQKKEVKKTVAVLSEKDWKKSSRRLNKPSLFFGDVEKVLDDMPEKPIFDLVISSPPYDIGKSYEKKIPLDKYIEWQTRIITKIAKRVKDTGSVCWEVGNYVEGNHIVPLDFLFDPIFEKLGFTLRNRVVWHFGHGLNTKRRFSGRYEVVLWYTKTENYKFNLDAVRIPSKYPGKRYFKGPRKGQLSGNPHGKNPEDVWEIPNVNSNHIEKLDHPCQYPVGLAERFVLATTDPGDLVFDPFSGTSSSGVAALFHDRNFWGCELLEKYIDESKTRLDSTLDGTIRFRPFCKPIYNPKTSKLHEYPQEFIDILKKEASEKKGGGKK